MHLYPMSDPNPTSAAATLSAHADSVRAAPAPPATRYLVMVEGQSSAILHLPARGEVIVGRAPDAQVRVQDPTASRRHAKLMLTEGETTLIDLGSHNGTQVNGETIAAPRALHAGDVISVCDVTLVLKQKIQRSPERGIASLTQVRQRFEEELARTLEYRR